MKAKHAILLIAIGFCIGYVASLSSLLSRGESSILLFLATIAKVAGVGLLAYKVIKYEGFRKFMER